ncbi:hypothetical protein H0H92_009859 [Tricholoma furcatifolium]|nr:hypothetical protein H0H92_009859 [Tricholoma furcatifolium]
MVYQALHLDFLQDLPGVLRLLPILAYTTREALKRQIRFSLRIRLFIPRTALPHKATFRLLSFSIEMLSSITRRLRRQKARPVTALLPPDLCLRDSLIASPFPHVAEGGYRLYYELQQRRAHTEAHSMFITTPKPLHSHAPLPPNIQTRTPNASSSRHFITSPPPIPPRSALRPQAGTKPTTKTRRSGLGRISEASLVPPRQQRSIRKRKKNENIRQMVKAQAAEVEEASPTDYASTVQSSLFASTRSSNGHGTVDTPPTTVEDLDEVVCIAINFKDYDPFDRPDSRSSYHTARTHFSDP